MALWQPLVGSEARDVFGPIEVHGSVASADAVLLLVYNTSDAYRDATPHPGTSSTYTDEETFWQQVGHHVDWAAGQRGPAPRLAVIGAVCNTAQPESVA